MQINVDKSVNVGDTIYLKIYSPFKNVNERTGQIVDIKRTKDISDFFISSVRVDTMINSNSYDAGFKSFKTNLLIGSEIGNSSTYLFKNVRINCRFSNSDSAYKVLLRLIPLNKGVFMFEHGVTSGKKGCEIIDFIPALKNTSQNLDIWANYSPTGTQTFSRDNVFFFEVK